MSKVLNVYFILFYLRFCFHFFLSFFLCEFVRSLRQCCLFVRCLLKIIIIYNIYIYIYIYISGVKISALTQEINFFRLTR